MHWKKIKIGKVLKQYRIEHWIQNEVVYKQVSILNDGSVVLRGEKQGKDIGRKRQFIIDLKTYPDTLIFTRQLLLQGSIGLASKEVDGCIVTENMPMFSIEGIDSEYLSFFIKSDLFKKQVRDLKTSGTAQKSLHERQFLDLEIPMPSKADQKLIVDKCKVAELSFNELNKEINNQLNYLNLLRQSILQEAVQGKLVPQDASDEPAEQLLQRIKAEKARLVKEGKLKKEKELPPITEDEIPFELPEGWVWCRLGQIAEFINGDRSSRYPNRHEYVNNGIAWINTGHIEPDGTLSLSEMNYITREKFNSLSGGKIQNGDMVYCLRGATIGKTAFVHQFDEGAIASSLMIIRLQNEMNRFYAYYYLTGPLGKSEIKKFDNGSAQPNLSANNVGYFLFPLPPVAEQYKIVTKVQKHFERIKLLEEQMIKSKQQSQKLLQAILSEAFAGGKNEYSKNEMLTVAAEE